MALPEETAFSIGVYNSVFSPSIPTGSANLVQNPGFETSGSPFGSWTADTDGGNATITRASSSPTAYSGTWYCKIYSNNGGDVDGSVYQNISVSSGERYRFSFWSRTSDIYATMQGRVAVYDVTNAEWVIPREPTGIFPSTEWQDSSLYFTVPSGCSSIRIYLYQNINSDSYVYYDEIGLRLIAPGSLSLLKEYTSLINSYNHDITANLGFDTMSFTTAGDLNFIESWLESGLGRHVIVTEASSGVIWEGFVDEVQVQFGGFSMSIGPMSSIINRAQMAYNTIDWNTTPPIGGDSVVSQWIDETLSMQRYGILEGVITGGEGTAEEMYSILKALMSEIAWPATESTFSIGGSSTLSVAVNCKGYGHLLGKYYYKQVSIAGEQNASDKMKAVISRDPNNIFIYSDSTIKTNTSQVEAYEDGSKTALEVFKDIVNIADANDIRNTFTVYENMLVSYGPVSYDVAFTTSLSDGRIRSASGPYVDPWEVRPVKWLLVSDAFIGRSTDFTRPSEDPRMIFLESISYTAPYGLSITGGRASTFKQKIERLGLGGI